MESEPRKIYTIEDIAAELGVSKTTVSRAISGKGRIGQATRKRVLEFIEEHNYRPNVLARGLAQRKTYNLAFLLPGDYAFTEFPYIRDCMRGICDAAFEREYDILISMTEKDELAHIRRLVSNRKVDGMILSRTTVDPKIQNFLRDSGLPFVVIGPCDDPEIPSVDNKNREASRELTEILLRKGILRIALLGGDQNFRVTDSRLQGFLDAHKASQVPVEEGFLFTDIETPVRVAEAVDRAVEAGADGILCMDDIICGMCLEYMKKRQLRIPGDICVASFYDSSALEFSNPPVTAVRFDTDRLGRAACRKLLELLGEETGETEGALNYQVILRESTQFSRSVSG